MSFLFSDLQAEVKRRATRDQSGSEFTDAIKNAINFSLFRTARENLWRVLRRNATLSTVTSYTTGTGAAAITTNTKALTVTGATFITDNIRVGRRIKIGGSQKYFTIATITGETTLTIDMAFDGSTQTATSYEILPQEEYVLPPQANHRIFLWHRQYGYPLQMGYVPDQEFRSLSVNDITVGIPEYYRMWGEDMTLEQPLEGSALTIVSSSASDSSGSITIFGTVSGYPDYESINLNGTSTVTGSKTFTAVERVVKSQSTVGRVTVTANSGNTTIVVLPVGDTTAGIMYSRVQLWPLPNAIMDIYVNYYKDPWRLVNDNDIHDMGQEFDESIILLATAKLKYENSQEEGDRFFSMWKDELASLKKLNVDKIDWQKKLQRPWDRSLRARLHRGLSYMQIGTSGSYGPSGYR